MTGKTTANSPRVTRSASAPRAVSIGWCTTHPHVLPLTLLLIGITLLFSYTIVIRQPWFGTLSADRHQWLTGSTVKFTRNWYREGALHLGFLMLENPHSVEFPTLESRQIYISYPPGTLLPIYAVSKLIHQEPSPGLVQTFNLLNHFLIALGLALIVYLLLIRLWLHPIHAGLFAGIPPLFVLLLPAPLYWFQNVFFSDQAIILPFVLMLLGEVAREFPLSDRQSRWLAIAQGVVLWYGFFTDWFFVFLALVIYGKRLLRGELPHARRQFFLHSLAFWMGPITAISLFAMQLLAFHQWETLLAKFLFRSGSLNENGQPITDFYDRFWGRFVPVGYGELASYLLWGSLLLLGVVLWRHALKPGAGKRCRLPIASLPSLMGITLLPCFLEIYALKNHSWSHDFSALKLLVPLSIIPFVVLPVWLLGLWRKLPVFQPHETPHLVFSRMILGINLAMLVCAGSYTLSAHPRYRGFFPQPLTGIKELTALTQQFTYHDIIITRNFEIPANPPQLLSYTMKRIYKVNQQADLDRITAPIREPFRVIDLGTQIKQAEGP